MYRFLCITFLSLACSAWAAPYRILAPATPGGGYDTLARSLAMALNETRLGEQVAVYNLPGDGGVKGLQEFVKHQGDPQQLVVFGLTTLGALNTVPNAGVSLRQLTPVARLVSDYEVILVPSQSALTTLPELVAAYKGNPGLRFGGASPASVGQLFIAGVLRAGGASLKGMRWVPSSGNLQAVKAMQQNELDVVSVSLGIALDELQTGKVRALALSAPEPVPGVDIPTAQAQGFKTELVNWRGVFAPGGLTESQKLKLSRDFQALGRSSAWQAKLASEKQNSAFQPGLSFGYFLKKEELRVRELLTELGLAQGERP